MNRRRSVILVLVAVVICMSVVFCKAVESLRFDVLNRVEVFNDCVDYNDARVVVRKIVGNEGLLLNHVHFTSSGDKIKQESLTISDNNVWFDAGAETNGTENHMYFNINLKCSEDYTECMNKCIEIVENITGVHNVSKGSGTINYAGFGGPLDYSIEINPAIGYNNCDIYIGTYGAVGFTDD